MGPCGSVPAIIITTTMLMDWRLTAQINGIPPLRLVWCVLRFTHLPSNSTCNLIWKVLLCKAGKSLILDGALWLRTGNNNNYYNANGLTADGVNNNAGTSTSRLVRPALHSLAAKDKGRRFSRIRRVHWPSNRTEMSWRGFCPASRKKSNEPTIREVKQT